MMQLHIRTGDRRTDDLLRAALPFWEARLSLLAGDGLVLVMGDTLPVPDERIAEAAVVLVAYRHETWLTDPLHRRLSESVPYAALPWPVSLPAWEKAILQLGTAKAAPAGKADLLLVPEESLVRCGQKSVRLTDREFRLLTLLLENRGQAVPKAALIAAVWPDGVEGNACEVHMTHLRKKLTSLLGDGAIGSIRGKGYILR